MLFWANNLKKEEKSPPAQWDSLDHHPSHLVLEFPITWPSSPTLGTSWSLSPSFEDLPSFSLLCEAPSYLSLLRLRKEFEQCQKDIQNLLFPKEVPSRAFPFREVPLLQEGVGFLDIHPLHQFRSPIFKSGVEASDWRSIWGGWAAGSTPWVPTLYLAQADPYIEYVLLWWREEDNESHHGCPGKKILNWTRYNSKWTIP